MKKTVLWLTKPHEYNRKAEAYCIHRYRKASNRKYQLFWLNADYLYSTLSEKHPGES